jgi:NAD(P)-dependent dehydrogenase (short-subunit alcohol dehydrogenase family)
MNLVLVDVQQDALDQAAAELTAQGATVMACQVDVSDASAMAQLAVQVQQRFGGLIWENSVADWEWVLGVNLWGVVHGVRLFTPMMLQAAQQDPDYQGHIVNTASMAGLLTTPNMGVYNVSKHAVVALSETLYQDLQLVSHQVGASVLCPYFVPTGISQSHRNRPHDIAPHPPTTSQLMGQAMMDKAVSSGKVSAAEVAQQVFDAVQSGQFYIYSHPQALDLVAQRLQAVVAGSNPPDPFVTKPELGASLRQALSHAEK